MKQKYKLTTLPIFERDLIDILDYIAVTLKNPSAANQLLNEVYEAVNNRLLNPLAFEKYFPKDLEMPHYRIRVQNYIIFYAVINNEMELRRILHKRRDFTDLFNIL